MSKVVLSSGHGLHVPGASAILDEVEEARAVVPEVAKVLRANGHEVVEFHDNTSHSQEENLKTIVDFHNSQGPHDLDVSVHFNAYIPTTGGRGTEVLYVTQPEVAAKVSAAIAAASGLIDRGAHARSDLYFLNKTTAPAILIEICFCDAAADADRYEECFTEICRAIAEVAEPVDLEAPAALKARGKVSWFGGPDDTGVAPDEGLAFIYSVSDKPHLFLPEQPSGTTGLARRLDPDESYCALRWDYDQFPKEFLRGPAKARIRAPETGKEFLASPADWGPHVDTGRVADISPGLMNALGIETDDEIEIEYPV